MRNWPSCRVMPSSLPDGPTDVTQIPSRGAAPLAWTTPVIEPPGVSREVGACGPAGSDRGTGIAVLAGVAAVADAAVSPAARRPPVTTASPRENWFGRTEGTDP